MELLTLGLPWPPSVNHYWHQRGAKRFLSEEAKMFRSEVTLAFIMSRHPGFGVVKLSLTAQFYPPDNRKRDIDNLLKPLLDALQHAGVYADDYNIDELIVRREPHNLNTSTVIIKCL